MYVMAVIWILSSGEFKADPWLYTQSFEGCETAVKALHGDPDKMLFFTACLSRDNLDKRPVFALTFP
jgi:hypothetical protein